MRSPILAVAYAHKYEPMWMVDDLLENTAWADVHCPLDQRDRTSELWSVRAERVAELRRLATAAGADWCLIMDPDERLEEGAGEVIRELITRDPGLRYTFPFRELWTPKAYRVDGVWGRKTRRRLFHLRAPMVRRVLVETGADIYHLKMIDPANRELRARVHNQANTWDNHRLGFDYLTDDAGARLVEVPPGRGYSPPYRPYRFEVPEALLDG